jgi:hypothetical protein
MKVIQSKESKNKALVLEAFDTLFNQRDYVAAEGFWSPNYIQHSAHIEPGREGLFNPIRSDPQIRAGRHRRGWGIPSGHKQSVADLKRAKHLSASTNARPTGDSPVRSRVLTNAAQHRSVIFEDSRKTLSSNAGIPNAA